MTNTCMILGKLKDISLNDIYVSVDNNTIKCHLSDSLLEKIKEYVKIGDIIAIKGHLETSNNDIISVVCDKLSFLAKGGKNE